MRQSFVAVVSAMLVLSGCTTPLTDAGARVELITPPQADGCSMIKLFAVQGGSADDVLHKAMNQVAQLGGDSVGISDGQQSGTRSKITAVALKCHGIR